MTHKNLVSVGVLIASFGMLAACGSSALQKGDVSRVDRASDTVCFRGQISRCTTMGEMSRLGYGDVKVGDCFEVRLEAESAVLLEAHRVGGCQRGAAATTPSAGSSSTTDATHATVADGARVLLSPLPRDP
jgi:hypothetical protein